MAGQGRDEGGRHGRKGCGGFSLVELLISITILGIIMAGIQQILQATISAYGSTGQRQGTVAAGRFAMERMVAFVQESDGIANPVSDTAEELLKVTERVLDTYNNATHAYGAAGDGIPDADNDADGLVNEGGGDPPEYVTFSLDKSDGSNWKLLETLPDYGTASTTDYQPPRVLCEHVSLFACRRLAADLVEIQLSLTDASGPLTLKTRVRLR